MWVAQYRSTIGEANFGLDLKQNAQMMKFKLRILNSTYARV